jgi:Fe-S-cluster containining protein
MPPSLSEIVLSGINRDDLAGRMDAFFEQIDRTVAGYFPVCRNRGECCHFSTYGHKLYVTSIELIHFVRHALPAWRKPEREPACPYQIEGLCAARSFRPLGCRIFFCDPDTRDWQGPEYERRLIELRQIGTDFVIDYRYIEWLSAIGELTEALRAKNLGFAGIDAPAAGMID